MGEVIKVSAAWFALDGALIGVLGTVLTELARGRRDDRKLWREEFRSVCAEFVSEVSRLQDLSHALRKSPGDSEIQRAALDAHSRLRGLQNRLQLTSRSEPTQEAARWLLHCDYYLWKSTQGGKGEFWEAQAGIHTWLAEFYLEARKELGLGSSPAYQEPPDGLPIPGQKHKAKDEQS
jgi:hypothetical protein